MNSILTTSPEHSPTMLHQPRSHSPPTLTFHPSLMPKPAGIIGSAAGGSHYSGAKIYHRRSDIQRASFGTAGHEAVVLDEKRAQVVNDLKELYSCRPSLEIFQRSWRHDAVFEDPLSLCKGISEIAPQFYAMPKVFSKSTTIASRILSSTHHPNRIIYSQTQEYIVRILGIKKTVKSIVIVDLDDEDKIIHVEDQWNGEEPPTSWGLGSIRRLNGKATPWLVRVPKDLHKSL